MPKRTGDFEAFRLERLADPQNAVRYLNTVLEDSPDVFLEALQDVIKARNVSDVAKSAGVTRESLYRSFSAAGNPEYDTLVSVLRTLGIRFEKLAVTHDHESESRPSSSAKRADKAVRNRHRTSFNSGQLAFEWGNASQSALTRDMASGAFVNSAPVPQDLEVVFIGETISAGTTFNDPNAKFLRALGIAGLGNAELGEWSESEHLAHQSHEFAELANAY